jgi:hypothetical protein
LKAQPFDPVQLQLSGSGQTVARQVGGSTVHYGPMSASENGRLAYGSSVLPDSQLFWIDRSGTEVGRVGEPGDYTSVQLSPQPPQPPHPSWIAPFRDPIWQFVGVLVTVLTLLGSWIASIIHKKHHPRQ